MNAAIENFGTDPDRNVNFNPTPEDLRNAPKKPPMPEVSDAAWERDILNQLSLEEGPDIRSMTANEFFSHLSNTMTMANANSLAFDKVMAQENGTPLDYYKLATNTLVSNAARAIVIEANRTNTPAEKEKFLNQSKELFISVSAGLRNHAVKNTDHNAVRSFFYNERNDPASFSKLKGDLQALEKNGVQNYMDQVKAQNAAGKQMQQPQQPQMQQAQVQKQAQIQQPEGPKPQKSGPSI